MEKNKERSLVILKPDAVQRTLIGDIINRIEKTGLKLTAMKFVNAEEDKLWEHYNKDDKWFEAKGKVAVKNRKDAGMSVDKEAIEYGKDIIRLVIDFMACGPVVIMVWEGHKSIDVIKKLVGGTEPATSDVGTIRGDYTIDSYELANSGERSVRNLVHCSDEPAEAEKEIAVWFTEEEIIKYRLISDAILYDVNLDGIKE